MIVNQLKVCNITERFMPGTYDGQSVEEMQYYRKVPVFMKALMIVNQLKVCNITERSSVHAKGGLSHFPPKFKNIFVVVITFSPFLLCKSLLYQLVAYCVCFKMICKKSL